MDIREMKRDALRHIYGHLEQSSHFVEVTVGSRDRKTDFGYIRADFDSGDATIDTFCSTCLLLSCLLTLVPLFPSAQHLFWFLGPQTPDGMFTVLSLICTVFESSMISP